MDFEKTPLYNEFLRVTSGGNTEKTYHWTAVIIANGKEIKTFKVIDIDTIRDYVNNYADVMFATVQLLAGDYVLNVYPYRQDLEIVLYKTPMDLLYGTANSVQQSSTMMTYKAVLSDTTDPRALASDGLPFNKAAMELAPPISVRFELIRIPIMKLRMITCGQIFRKEVPINVVTGLMTKAVNEINASRGEQILGVHVSEANNKTPTEHVSIPHPMSLIDVPGYVQKNCNGIYTNGIGFYVQGQYWYIYAPFDVTKFKTTPKTLTVMRIPQKRFEGIDRTWRLEGDNLTILGSGGFIQNDTTALSKLNEGVGVIYADAGTFMDGFAVNSGNKATVSRRNNNNEFAIETRDDNFNRAPRSAAGITSNACVEQSKLSIRSGSVMTVVWNHSKAELVTPCMPVRVIVLDGNAPREIEGVVLMSDTQHKLQGQGASAMMHISVTTLHIFYKPTS
jgi:hypothetical protein